jgi:hypothetical protein
MQYVGISVRTIQSLCFVSTNSSFQTQHLSHMWNILWSSPALGWDHRRCTSQLSFVWSKITFNEEIHVITLLRYLDGFLSLCTLQAWMTDRHPTKDDLCCQTCRRPTVHILQIYAPLQGSPYDRTFNVFGCLGKSCWKTNQGWGKVWTHPFFFSVLSEVLFWNASFVFFTLVHDLFSGGRAFVRRRCPSPRLPAAPA